MQVDLLVFLIVLVFGLAAFILGVIALIWKAVSAVGMSLVRLVTPGRKARAQAVRQAGLICRNPHCRKVEYRSARFCSQCGRPLWMEPSAPQFS